MLTQLLIGMSLGLLIALLARKAGALNDSGAVAAAFTGGLIFGLGGLPWATLLLTFFISSSALSRLFQARKTPLSEKFSKGSRRDWGQVLANGGLGTALVLAHSLLPAQAWTWLAFAGAMAAVNADTWGTELGVFSRTPPRLLTSGKIVDPGASGGVTWLGYLASMGGAALVGALAVPFTPGASPLLLLAVIVLGGVSGASFDSLLGATVQSIYFCPRCQKETERHPYHTCGTPTTQVRGWHWLDNDWVNFTASLVGALVTVLSGSLLL
jgi:uncharacterized protein (TIGR00297 family)